MSPLRLPAWVDRFDERAERVVTVPQGSVLDTAAHALSAAADRSRLWIALAMVRAVRGRPGDRPAAARMIVVVGLESAIVHGGVKRLFLRRRPTRQAALRFRARRPPSSSFPSGHAASAATAGMLLADGTTTGPALAALVGAVAWSRVQTGLHHVSDIAAGLAFGAAVGAVARRLRGVERGPTARP